MKLGEMRVGQEGVITVVGGQARCVDGCWIWD